MEIIDLLDKFRNEAFCRHGSNQEKAGKIFTELKSLLTDEEAYDIHDTWIHYAISHTSREVLGKVIHQVRARYVFDTL